MKTLRLTLMHSLLLTAMFVPAFAQQEMDPTWYNPWAKPDATAAAPVAKTESPKKLRNVSADSRDQAKVKKAVKRQEPRESARVLLVAGK
jgi:hypothetical protein